MSAAPDGDRAPRRGGVLDRRRLRTSYRIALTGPLLGVLAAAVLALLGAGGQAGLAVVLVLSSAGCVLAAFVTVFLAMVDEYRREDVGGRRILVALGLFAVGGALLIMSVGAAAGG